MRLRATAGDAVLASSIFAASELGAGGIIEATASGDIIASGRFRAAGVPPGCIGLAAGGTVDTIV